MELTQISIPETRTLAEERLLTIRRRVSWLELELDTQETFTAEEAQPAAVHLLTTQTRARVLRRAETISTQARTDPFTATTARVGIGRRTAAADGSRRTCPSPAFSNNSRHDLSARSGHRTSVVRWDAALEEDAGDNPCDRCFHKPPMRFEVASGEPNTQHVRQ